jgi:hypothetical protein
MSSNINTIAANIDATFPVAGQDNSSQGFRDNFSAIKLAFSTATTEITNLQLHAAQLDTINDFTLVGGAKNAIIQNSVHKAIGGTTNVTITETDINKDLDAREASYYKMSVNTLVNSTTTFSVSNWPKTDPVVYDFYGQLRLEIVAPDTIPHGINFTAPSGVILTDSSNVTLPYSASTGTTTVWDLWSVDGGARVFVKLVGGPYA